MLGRHDRDPAGDGRRPLKLRRATAGDADAIGALWDESARAGFGPLLPEGHPLPEFDPGIFRALIQNPDLHVLVADDAGEALGHTTFGKNRDVDVAADVGEIRALFVRPAAWRRGVGSALASGVAIGFFFLSLARTTSEGGMWPLLVARFVSVVLFAGIALASRSSFRMPAGVAGLVVGAGTIDMLANALYVLAARQGPLSIVVTLSSLYPASTVLLARLILRERLSNWQVTGVVCALAAVVLIVSS